MIFLNGAGADRKTFLFTSALESEGKTTMALHFAAMLSARGKQVIVADVHWQKPTIGRILGVAGRPGLTDLLESGGRHEELLVRDTRLPQLSVLARGTRSLDLVQDTLEERLRAILERARATADFILLDGAPANSGPEILILNRLVDAVLLVVACDRTQQDQVAAARHAVEKHGGNLAGVILNRVPRYLPDYYRTV
jgi:capsular exopolysaccharide synthesis family protein